MSKALSIKAQSRNQIGRAGVKAVRRAGKVPGVLYGKKKSLPIEINALDLKTMLHKATSENVIVNVELETEGRTDQRLALLQDVQHHPLKDYIVHVDLHEIAQDEKIHAEVQLQEFGEPLGVKNSGGLLATMMRTLRVECLPKDLPELITVDVSALEIDMAIHVHEIKVPEGVTVMNPKELVVFTVTEPIKEEEIKPVVAAELTQPEVIMEKKVEGEAPAAPAGKGGKVAPKETAKGGKDAPKDAAKGGKEAAKPEAKK
jgi:large subunit ribosomal protein L25